MPLSKIFFCGERQLVAPNRCVFTSLRVNSLNSCVICVKLDIGGIAKILLTFEVGFDPLNVDNSMP